MNGRKAEPSPEKISLIKEIYNYVWFTALRIDGIHGTTYYDIAYF